MLELSNYQRRKLAYQAVEFFKKDLFKNRPHLAKRVSVDVKFTDIDDADGICDHHDIVVNPRRFTLLIHRQLRDTETIVVTVAHEMTHVWQFATGRLRDYRDPVHRFDNEYYSANMAYRDMPWEIEARKFEKSLYKKWKKHYCNSASIS